MSVLCSFDAAGRRRSPATTAEFHLGRTPGNKGMTYPADPPRVEESVAIMRQAGGGPHGDRVRGLIVVLWRAGLRISKALDLREGDLEPGRGALLVREGKGGRRREVGMDGWGWEQLRPWLDRRVTLPAGSLFCVIDGPTRGRPWTSRAPSATSACRRGRREAPLRPAPAASRPRGRDGPRRGAAERDPASARSREPASHDRIPARDRQRRDHQRRPRAHGTDDAREHRTTSLSDPNYAASAVSGARTQHSFAPEGSSVRLCGIGSR